MPSSKLREATSVGRKNTAVGSRGSFEPAEIISGPRGSRAKRPIVEESGSEDDENDEEEEEEQPSEAEDEEADGDVDVDVDADTDVDDLEDAEGESDDADADGDVVMEDPDSPPPPIIRMTGPSSKPTLTVTPAPVGKLRSVESKHMQVGNREDEEEEELSELDSDAEANDEEGGEEDAEGEDVMEEGGDEDQEMDEESDGETPAAEGSRGSTPDVTKMTKRQRSRLDQVMGSDFLQLPMGMRLMHLN